MAGSMTPQGCNFNTLHLPNVLRKRNKSVESPLEQYTCRGSTLAPTRFFRTESSTGTRFQAEKGAPDRIGLPPSMAHLFGAHLVRRKRYLLDPPNELNLQLSCTLRYPYRMGGTR